MNQSGLKLLTLVLLLMHLIAPAQAVLASTPTVAQVKESYCMQLMANPTDCKMYHGENCCQKDKSCVKDSCKQCQTCAALAMLINLHQQTVVSPLFSNILSPVAEYCQSIPIKNLYRPPITSL